MAQTNPQHRPVAVLLATAVMIALLTAAAAPALATAGTVQSGGDGDNAANLFIKQPYYVDSEVKQSNTNGTTVYKVRGNTHEIELQNANESEVTDFGVVNGPATMSYNKDIGRYVLNAQGSDGSYRVFWTVSRSSETVTGNNTTTTRTTTERFTAVVQVNEADTRHVSREKYEETEKAAANWSVIEDTFGPIGDEEKPIEDKIERAATLLKFVESPFEALEGQIATILLLLLTTPGGIIVGGSVLIAFAALLRSLVRRLQRREKQMEDIDDLEREKDQQAAQKKLMDLSQCDPTDAGLNDHHAAVIREKVGPNLLMVFDSLAREFPRGRWTKVHLQILNQLGYAARTTEVGEDGSISSVEFIEPGDVTEDLLDHEDVHNLGNPPDTLVHAVTPKDLRSLREEFVRSDIDASVLDLPVANEERAEGDLVDAWDIDIGTDFESRERFSEEILNILSFVGSHPYTDDEGNVREEMDLLSLLNLFATTGAERYDLPRMADYQEAFELAIENLSQSERSQTKIADIRNNATLSND